MLNLSRWKKFSKPRKAQFFVLSAFTIVTILYFVSQWIAPYTIPDTSSVALMEEPYIFNNIIEKARSVVKSSQTCETMVV
jgi:ABC-type antimicrobial peptide transport system permease subunit